MTARCERCGGPPPVEGETCRHHWPCGCAVVPEDVYATQTGDWPQVRDGRGERCFVASGLDVVRRHPTREGAIAAWRAALGPYQAPVRFEVPPTVMADAARVMGEAFAKLAAETQTAVARFGYGAADPAGDKADCMRVGGMRPAQRPPCSDCGGRWSGVLWPYNSAERRGFCRCNHRWSVAWDGSVTLVRAASEAT